MGRRGNGRSRAATGPLSLLLVTLQIYRKHTGNKLRWVGSTNWALAVDTYFVSSVYGLGTASCSPSINSSTDSLSTLRTPREESPGDFKQIYLILTPAITSQSRERGRH